VSGAETVGVPPAVTHETAPFWEAADRGELVVERCTACGTSAFPPHGICPACGCRTMTWTEVVPPGVIYSYTINDNQWTLTADARYGIALVEFPDHPGLRMIGLMDGFEGEPSIDERVGFRLDPGPAGFHRVVFVPWNGA
jgi:uncharacterized protein